MNLTHVEQFLRQRSAVTPVLLVNRETLRKQASRWISHLPDVVPHFAVKSNVDPLVLRELFGAGIKADVASAFELEVCRAMGLSGSDMILSNPRKDVDTLRTAAVVQPWAIAVDSEEEVDRLAVMGIPSENYRPVLLVRIKVPTKGVKQDLSSKFGVRVLDVDADPTNSRNWEQHLKLSALESILNRGRELGYQQFGLAFHVGTQCADPIVYHNAFQLCRLLALRLALQGLQITWIDLGGGFADGRVAQEREAELDELLTRAAAPDVRPLETAHDKLLYLIGLGARVLRKDGFQVVAEPGRLLVSDAACLVSSIIYDRSTTNRRISRITPDQS